MAKRDIQVYNNDGSFRYRMEMERVPSQGDLMQLDGFLYEVEKVLFSDNSPPRILLSLEQLEIELGEFTDP